MCRKLQRIWHKIMANLSTKYLTKWAKYAIYDPLTKIPENSRHGSIFANCAIDITSIYMLCSITHISKYIYILSLIHI